MAHAISDADSYRSAATHAAELVDRGAYEEALRLAEEATCVAGQEPLLTQLRAWVFTEAGQRCGNRGFVQLGADQWQALGSLDDSTIAYNVANAQLALFQIDLAASGYVDALLSHREPLQKARDLFSQVGDDWGAKSGLRVQALTNCGNALDLLGRDLEALLRYDEAVTLDPLFGMALGNRGITLSHYAPFMHEHTPITIALAVSDLEQALTDREGILRIGGPNALKNFENVRAGLPPGPPKSISSPNPKDWEDPHMRWCLERRLFLHVSHTCLRPETRHFDPLFPRRISGGLTDDEQRRIDDIVDAFNALSQDFVATRYLTWLAIAEDSPIVSQAQALSARAAFHDSHQMARWGARTGLALQALGAATNLLDKAAAFLHLYFRTGRPRQQVYFRGFWRAKRRKDHPPAMEPAFAAELAPSAGNAGLLALCDLACDMEADTPLGRLLGIRHAATHRFLVAHHAVAPPSSEWLERMEWTDLISVMHDQLRVARAALIYLVRTVDAHEARIAQRSRERGTPRPELPLMLVDPHVAEME